MSLHITLTPLLAIATDRRNWMLLEGESQTATRYAPTLPMLIKVCQDKLKGINLSVLAPHLTHMVALEAMLAKIRTAVPIEFVLPRNAEIRLGNTGFSIVSAWTIDTRTMKKVNFLEHQLNKEGEEPTKGDDNIWAHTKGVATALESFMLFQLRIADSLEGGLNACIAGFDAFDQAIFQLGVFITDSAPTK